MNETQLQQEEEEESKKESFELFEINKSLNCGFTFEQIEICVKLLKEGIEPEGLANVLLEIQKRSLA